MMEDEGLIRAHRAGDREAFPALVDRYRDRIYRLCYRLTLDKEDALDLCQLTFWKAYRGLADYDRSGALFTWLYRIASNAAIDLLRDRKRRAVGLARARPELRRPPERRRPAAAAVEAAADDPARLALRKELHVEVARAVSGLSPEHRATLMLRASEGLSYREIAAALDCPVGTVMSRLHAARERVREALAGYLGGDD
jgi:RNA polymerase sigma-70 factor (ECF subfamily)